MLVIWSQLVDLECLCLIKLQQLSPVRPCFLISTDLPILKLQRHDTNFQELLMALRWKDLGCFEGWILPFNLGWWASKALFSVVVQYQAYLPVLKRGPWEWWERQRLHRAGYQCRWFGSQLQATCVPAALGAHGGNCKQSWGELDYSGQLTPSHLEVSQLNGINGITTPIKRLSLPQVSLGANWFLGKHLD